MDRPEQPQTIRRKAFIPQQKLPEADEFGAANENRCRLFPTSKKRDAVGTGQIVAAGKIAGIAVVAEYLEPGVSRKRRHWISKEILLCHL